MKIVLTNDDGIEAPGLQVLYDCLKDSGQVVIVAPQKQQSGIAHRITTRTPIRVATAGENRHAIDGTPADCTRIALKQIAPDVDWLVAGINPGANLGSDVYNSGTVAAAREAAILGCPSIAISQYIAKDHDIDWSITGRHAKGILTKIMAQQLEASNFWNINLPHPLDDRSDVDFAFCSLDTNPHKYEFITQGSDYVYQGSIHERPRRPGTDVAVCFDESKISVTQIPLGII